MRKYGKTTNEKYVVKFQKDEKQLHTEHVIAFNVFIAIEKAKLKFFDTAYRVVSVVQMTKDSDTPTFKVYSGHKLVTECQRVEESYKNDPGLFKWRMTT